jgi:hypothetical protein
MTTRAAKRRVAAVLNAISNLHQGDLLAVLDLDEFVQGWHFDKGIVDEYFLNSQDGRESIKSLKAQVQTGEQLGRLLEAHLIQVMVFGEVQLPSWGKRRWKKALGGRRFDD